MGDMKANASQIPEKINDILRQYVTQVVEVYHTHIHKIILFGSYARGDFHNDSDIDIMVLEFLLIEAVIDFPLRHIVIWGRM